MSRPVGQEFLDTVPFKDRAAFEFYYLQTAGENLPVRPEYTWDQFATLGYAPFEETADNNLATLDKTGSALIPNYTDWANDIPPMLSVFKGRPAESIDHNIQNGRASIINASHPSLASPILVARSLIEALGPDIRQNMYIVYGAFPTIFSYKIGDEVLSPVGVARSLANTLLTVAKTPSNESDNDVVVNWQKSQRDTFKTIFEEKTAPQGADKIGAIVILCVTGQRMKDGSVLRPDGKLDYLHGRDVWNVGVDDQLLGPEIISPVWMQIDPVPIHINKDADVHLSNKRTCVLASHNGITYPYESRFDQTRRWTTRNRGKALATVLHLG